MVAELPPTDGVSRGLCHSFEDVIRHCLEDKQPCIAHHRVNHPWIGVDTEGAIRFNLEKPAQKGTPGYYNPSEEQVTIVSAVEAQLGPDITRLDPW